MRYTTIDNPHTGKRACVKAFKVQPKEVAAQLRDGRSTVHDLGWELLGQAVELLEDEERDGTGDSAESSFALSIFENALDWRVGQAAVSWINAFIKAGKWPKPFEVGVTRKGDIVLIGASGAVVKYTG